MISRYLLRGRRAARSLAAVIGTLSLAATAAAQDEPRTPWRLDPAVGLPEWFSFRGEQRTRYEALSHQFRALRSGSDRIFAFRTLLEAKLSLDPVEVVVEGIDARQELADLGTPINTTIVDSLDILQAYAAINFDDLLADGDRLRVLVGRHTMDVGSRRLVARNRYRNTINSFTGVNATWTNADGASVQAFWTMPVRRLPIDPRKLLNNEAAWNEEYLNVQFWGMFVTLPEVFERTTVEFGGFGLFETDSEEVRTRRRELITINGRLRRAPEPGRFDFEVELAEQFGESIEPNLSLPLSDADHRASFQHAEVGHTFDTSWKPRVALQFDNATGDQNPNDGENERFDTLFGARRFDFGPTSIYGAFARSNLTSPGYRITMRPSRDVQVLFAHRWFWLNSDTDAWTTGRVRDTSGNSGDYLGTQAEVRLRWDPLPGNLRLEGGVAYLNKGSFIDNAPNGNGEGDSVYSYVQTVLKF